MSQTPTPQRQVAQIEIHHLDEVGYGPDGTMTRRAWRALCLEKLLAGKDDFCGWQFTYPKHTGKVASFAYTVTHDDGSTDIQNIQAEPTSLDFIAQDIEHHLDCDGYVFETEVFFSHAVFNAAVDFKGAIFRKEAWFNLVTFGEICLDAKKVFSYEGELVGYHSFDSAIFHANVMFHNMVAKDHLHFQHARFCKSAYFSEARCYKLFEFSNVFFDGDAGFWGIDFQDANFEQSIFNGQTVFSGANFDKSVSFVKAGFHNQISFNPDEGTRQTRFAAEADFENAVFNNVGHFEQVVFEQNVPSFLGVDTATTRLEFSGEEFFPKNDVSEQAIKRLGHLKRLVDEHGQIDQALMFNALELRIKRLWACARLKEKPLCYKVDSGEWWEAQVTWLFEVSSDYGRSFTKPLKWYMGLLGFTFLLALLHAAVTSPLVGTVYQPCVYNTPSVTCVQSIPPKNNDLPLSGWRAAFEYTLYRSGGVFDFSSNDEQKDAVTKRLFGQTYEPWLMRVWGIIKTIASTALLFLMALGLRNTYRVK